MTIKPLPHLMTLLSTSVLAVGVYAETAAPALETLVVTGERPSLVVGAQQLDTAQQQPGIRADSAELLRGITGVQADSRSNFAQDTRITLRGFGARSAFGVRGLELQIDGIPLTTPDGQGQFSGALLDGVTQVQLLTGPVASLYGNGAGGVISLKTAAPTRNRLSLGTSADEEGLTRHTATGEYRRGDFGLRLQATQLDADGNRPHASAERDQLGAQAYYRFDNGIEAQYRFDHEDAPLLQDPLGLTEAQWLADPYQLNGSADFFNTRKSIDHRQHALSLRQQQGHQRWQLAVWTGERDIQQYLAQRGDAPANSGGVVDLSRDFSGANGNYTWDFSLVNRSTSFTLGGEWARMEDTRKGYINNGGVAGDLRRDELDTAENRDGYALLQWQAAEGWDWLLGARHSQLEFDVDDHYVVPAKNADDSGERNFSQTSNALSTRYQLDSRWSMHAAIGEGFETPTLTEMAYTNGDQGFNNNLRASDNRQRQMGVDYQYQGLKLSATAFAISSRDELVVDQSVNGRTTYRNAAGTERKGVEFNGLWQIAPAWDARLAITSLDAAYDGGQYDGLQLPGVARLNQYAQLNWRPWANEFLQLSIAGTHRSEVATHDSNAVKAPDYTILDMAASGSIGLVTSLELRWWLKLANATDETYVGSVIVNQSNNRAFEPASQRNLAGGLSLDVNF
jgi:iron complex outermembrane recepter protein